MIKGKPKYGQSKSPMVVGHEISFMSTKWLDYSAQTIDRNLPWSTVIDSTVHSL